ncbi:MAG TPA: TonB family protein [Steroidobacteraceae bacterium]|jgi:TonB family protein|nr:TonB family protein [Steroidobacteraceae bacterium]
MSTVTFHRFVALLGYVSCLAAAPAMAQMGPIQPVLVTDGKVEYSHDRPDIGDFTVPVEVRVAASGAIQGVVVSESSGNAQADALAVEFMKQRKFLPGLDDRGTAVDSVVRVTVNMYKRGAKKVARVTIKPPPLAQETLRVQTLLCADFLWEIERMDKEAGIDDLSLEVMPYTSARMYMEQKNVPDSFEEKFWDEWPGALRKIVDRCERDQTRMFFSEVLVPTLDGVMPEQTATASAR